MITASEVHDPDVFCLVGIARAMWQDPLELADVRLSQVHLPAGVERGEARYSASKLLNVMHARLLASEAPGVGVAAFNPSVVPGTGIARERNVLQRLLWKYVMSPLAPLLPGARSLERSASDLLWLATEADLLARSGGLHGWPRAGGWLRQIARCVQDRAHAGREPQADRRCPRCGQSE